MKPTFEQALWYLGRVRDELVHRSEDEASVIVDSEDEHHRSPFYVYYGHPPYIPQEQYSCRQVNVSRNDSTDDLWNSAYRLVNT
jgi:hypothetical protein